jgi:hypothetical protein
MNEMYFGTMIVLLFNIYVSPIDSENIIETVYMLLSALILTMNLLSLTEIFYGDL